MYGIIKENMNFHIMKMEIIFCKMNLNLMKKLKLGIIFRKQFLILMKKEI